MQSDLFVPSQLTLLRELEGTFKSDLAKDLGVSPATITGWENGARVPSSANVRRLSVRFGVDPDYFTYLDQSPSADKPFFRSLRSTTVAERTKSASYANVAERTIRTLDERVNFPSFRDFGLIGFETPEESAAIVRSALGLGTEPIPNLIDVVEAAGIFVVFGPKSSTSVDAFSRISHPNPIVVLNPAKNDYYRQRFDLAHEVGHIALHSSEQAGSKVIEQEANRFAAELLAPSEIICDYLPKSVTSGGWRQLRILKEQWGISMQSLLYRSNHLGIMSDQTYRNAMVTVSKRGWRRGEPGNRSMLESPTLLPSAISLLNEFGYGPEDVAREAGVPLKSLQQVIRHAPALN